MLSPDNYAHNGTQGANRYSYVFNNPLKYNDPSGETPLDALATIGGTSLLGAGANAAVLFTVSCTGNYMITGAVNTLANCPAAAAASATVAAVTVAVVIITQFIANSANDIAQAQQASNNALEAAFNAPNSSAFSNPPAPYTASPITFETADTRGEAGSFMGFQQDPCGNKVQKTNKTRKKKTQKVIEKPEYINLEINHKVKTKSIEGTSNEGTTKTKIRTRKVKGRYQIDKRHDDLGVSSVKKQTGKYVKVNEVKHKARVLDDGTLHIEVTTTVSELGSTTTTSNSTTAGGEGGIGIAKVKVDHTTGSQTTESTVPRENETTTTIDIHPDGKVEFHVPSTEEMTVQDFKDSWFGWDLIFEQEVSNSRTTEDSAKTNTSPEQQTIISRP